MDESDLVGFKELDRKLQQLGDQLGGKTLRQSVGYAMQPVLVRARLEAPKGKRAHKTYKGRLVAPGFLSRNIKKRTYLAKNKYSATAVVGVSREAFYGLTFLHRGFRHVRSGKKIAPDPWLERALEPQQQVVINRLKSGLTDRITKIARKK